MEKTTKKVTRGIRNNNPGNIRLTNPRTHWLGLDVRQSDESFCQFVSMRHGVRALIALLRTYVTKHGCDTVRKIVTRYAPPSENNTLRYISIVLRFFQAVDFSITLDDKFIDKTFFYKSATNCQRDVLWSLCSAICMQECGYVLTREMFDLAFDIL